MYMYTVKGYMYVIGKPHLLCLLPLPGLREEPTLSTSDCHKVPCYYTVRSLMCCMKTLCTCSPSTQILVPSLSSQDLQDDMSDMLEQTNEIMEVMGTPFGLPDDVDEDDLEAGVRVCVRACVCVCACVRACVCGSK